MSDVWRLVAATLLGCAGFALARSAFVTSPPPLGRVLGELARARPSGERRAAKRAIRRAQLRRVPFSASVLSDLRLLQRPPEAHAATLVGLGVAGLFGPPLTVAVLDALTARASGMVVPLVAGLGAAAALPALAHGRLRRRAAELRVDLRHQLSAYLDVVTMLLAGNVGNEGALRQAAQAGDGRLFSELRQRMLAAETSHRSLVAALSALGDDLELVEMQQIAASASLGATAGAPVARSLAAKCATLRAALAGEQEAQARVRTTKITVPLVGMSLLIMFAVIYPALNL